MAIAFGAVGASTGGTVGTTALSGVTVPAGIAVGNFMVIFLVTKYPGNPPTIPAGWLLLGSVVGGTGTGVGQGAVLVTCIYRIADATETVAVPVSIPGGNSAMGRWARWTKAADREWNFAIATGSDNVSDVSWSVAAGSDPGIVSGDMIICFSGTNFSAANAWSAEALAATGATFTGGAERLDANTTQGDDLGQNIWDTQVSAGPASAAPTFTATLAGTPAGTSHEGATLFLRLREVIPTGVAAGVGGASGVGASIASSVGVSDGAGAASGLGDARADTTGVAAGAGDASGIGAAIASSAGVAAGLATADGIGAAIAFAAGLAEGTSTAEGAGEALVFAAGLAEGASTAEGVGNAVASSIGIAAGVGAASGIGMAFGIISSVGLAEGTSTAEGVGNFDVVDLGDYGGLNEAILDFATGIYIVSRSIFGEYVNGLYVPRPRFTFPIVASVQPVTGRDLRNLPEGRSAGEVKIVYTAAELRTKTDSSDPDIVTIKGEPYEVSNVQDWDGPDGHLHFEVLVSRTRVP